MRADDIEPRADHCHASSGCGSRHGGKCDPGLTGKAAEAGIGQFHFGRQAAETPRACLTDAFQLSPDLAAAFGDQPDRNTLLGHGSESLIFGSVCLTLSLSIKETYDHVRDCDPVFEVPDLDP